MNKNVELIKNTIIIFFGKVCTQFISILLLPLYTSKLTTEEYGIVDVLSTYIFLLVPIITLELQQSVFRFLIDVRKDNKSKSTILTNSLILTFFQILLSIIVFGIINIFYSINYVVYLEMNIIANILSSFALQIARGLGDNKSYTIGSSISALVNIISNLVFILVFNMKVEGMLLSMFIGNLICCMYIFVNLKVYKEINLKLFSTKVSKKLLKYSIPLIPNSISWWIVSISDRMIISNLLNMSSNGIYAVANKFTTLFSGIYTIFNLSWSEAASKSLNDEDRDEFYSNTINNVSLLFSTICCIFVAALPFIFNIMVGAEYKSAYLYLPILLLGSLFNIIVGLYGSIYIALKNTKKISNSTILAAIINIVLNVLLIKYIGLYAAAISTVIAYFVIMIYRHIDINKQIKLKINLKKFCFILLFYIIISIVYYINNLFFNTLSLILSVIVSYVLNKKIICNLIKKTIEKGKVLLENYNILTK